MHVPQSPPDGLIAESIMQVPFHPSVQDLQKSNQYIADVTEAFPMLVIPTPRTVYYGDEVQ